MSLLARVLPSSVSYEKLHKKNWVRKIEVIDDNYVRVTLQTVDGKTVKYRISRGKRLVNGRPDQDLERNAA